MIILRLIFKKSNISVENVSEFFQVIGFISNLKNTNVEVLVNFLVCPLGGLCALGGVFILTLPIPIVVNSFASYYKNRLWRNEVAYKKRQRAKKRKEMELLMRDNLLNILTVPGICG